MYAAISINKQAELSKLVVAVVGLLVYVSMPCHRVSPYLRLLAALSMPNDS